MARATSVSRQFEPSASSFVRAGSVARGFESSSSRDPFYSQINRVAVGGAGMRAQASFLSPNNSILESVSQNSFISPPQSKYAVRETKASNGKFRSLEVSERLNGVSKN